MPMLMRFSQTGISNFFLKKDTGSNITGKLEQTRGKCTNRAARRCLLVVFKLYSTMDCVPTYTHLPSVLFIFCFEVVDDVCKTAQDAGEKVTQGVTSQVTSWGKSFSQSEEKKNVSTWIILPWSSSGNSSADIYILFVLSLSPESAYYITGWYVS